jgi:tetratricopeptide (TPR) repeat protein/DNA-binding XRE family transcriptional regulator
MKEISMTHFASILKDARLTKGWTQSYLADQLNTNQFTISRWESGRVFPSEYFQKKLCLLFEKSAEDFGFLSDRSHVPPTDALSPIWKVPYARNPFFTGREETLSHIYQMLTQEHRMALTQSVALSGLGGIGKTQIALEYAYQYRHHYRFIFWVNAATQDNLLTDLLEIAELIHLPIQNNPDRTQVPHLIKHWLTSNQDWLLILDNTDDLALIRDIVPYEHAGHLLLTSRIQALGGLARRIDVENMGIVEGMLLLLRRSLLLDRAEKLDRVAPDHLLATENLVIDLAFFPLAIDQAGAYIDEIGCSVESYRALYHQHRKELLRRRSLVPTDYPDSVATTWSLSFHKIEQLNATAANLLRLCAFLDPDTISEELLLAGASVFGLVSCDLLSLHEAIEVLRRFSFLTSNPDTKMFRIHRLVQIVLKDAMSIDQQRDLAYSAVLATWQIFPHSIELETWPQCLRHLAQAQSCAQLVEEYGFVEEQAISLLTASAQYLESQALYLPAEQLFQQVVQIQEKAGKSRQAEWAIALSNLANLYHNQGKYEQADSLYQQALPVEEATLGTDHLEVAATLYRMSLMYYSQWKYEQAEEASLRALQIRKQLLGPDHPEVAMSLTSLANLYQKQRKYEQAEPLFIQAVQIWEHAPGSNLLSLAKTLRGLGNVYMMQRKYDRAEPLYQRALQILEQIHGPEHPQVANSLHNLGILHQFQEQYEQAEAYYQRTLHIRERVLGEEHPDIIHPLQGIAEVACAQGKYEQAKTFYLRSLHTREITMGKEHPEVAYPLQELGNLYQLLEEKDTAESCYMRALQIREQALGKAHPEVSYPLYGLATLYQKRGETDKAEYYYQRAISIREQAAQYEYHHQDTADMLYDFAEFRWKQGKIQEAAVLYQQALTIQKATLGPSHPKTKRTESAYTEILQYLQA